MNKNVIISVAGTQFAFDENTPVEVISAGHFYNKSGKKYIRYEELDEDNNLVKCMIKLDKDIIEISKKGAYNSCMVFELGKNCMTTYTTPYGNMMLGITTNELIFMEDEDAIVVKIKYSLDINYAFVSECTADIKIVSAKAVKG